MKLVARLHGSARGLSEIAHHKLVAALADLRPQLTPDERTGIDALAEQHKERVRRESRPMTFGERASLARWRAAGRASFDFWVGRPHIQIDVGVTYPPSRRRRDAVTAFWSTDLGDMTAARALHSEGETFAPWVAYIDDSAAQLAVLLALIARRAGARDPPARSLASGDALLTAIRVGKLDGARARRKAEAARRHYIEAGDAATRRRARGKP